MSQEVGQTELKAKTQQLLDGPLKHIRAAAIAAALLPLASVAATPASAQELCQSAGNVCGFVWNDTNSNGIQDAGETGIEGAKVFIRYPDGTIVQTETGPDGFYYLSVTDGLTYDIGVQIPNGKQPSPDIQGGDRTADSDGVADGFGFSVATKVTVSGPENPNTDFGFMTSAAANPGTGTPGYWKNHPDDWPVDGIKIGGIYYTKAQIITWLGKVGKDKTTTIFASYVSAWLSVKIGNDPSCVSAAMASADGWLAVHPVGSNVSGSSAYWQQAEQWHQTMDAYNNGLLCAPHRQ